MGINVEEYDVKYGPMVLRRCRKLLGDETRAAETMQDVFVMLLRRQGGLTHSAPSSLLYKIATNLCLNVIRSEKRHPTTANEELLLSIADSQEPHGRFLTQSVLSAVFSDQLETSKLIAVLYFVDELTLEEISREVGMSVSGVRKRLTKVKVAGARIKKGEL